MVSTETITLELIDQALNDACNSIISCPMFILDEVLEPGSDEYNSAVVQVHNLAYSNALKSIGVALKYTHLSANCRKSMWTIEHCKKSMHFIYDMLEAGYLKDRIALEHILSIRDLDCKVYLRGVELFTE